MTLRDWLKTINHHTDIVEATAQPEKGQGRKIGIAFGGGGIKGTAHIGVLKVLAEYGIKPDMVAGTSIGSAIAALLGSGYDWKMMYDLFRNYDMESLFKMRPNRKGLIPANEYTDVIRVCTKGRRLEDMDIPVKIIAVDLVSHKRIVFSSGDTAVAVRASSALPGIFTPVEMGNMLLVDGYVLDNCPGDVVREMGADIVIAIDLRVADHSVPKNILGIVTRSLDIAVHTFQKVDCDIQLRPIEDVVDTLDVSAGEACFQLGEACAREHIEEILRLINE